MTGEIEEAVLEIYISIVLREVQYRK